MKIEKPRHDHKLTDLLKVCIFSLLMLAPLVASCSQWIYATINKNAYQSYSGTQSYTSATPVYQTNEVNSFEDLVQNNYYELHFTTTITFNDDLQPSNKVLQILSDYGNNVMNIINVSTNSDGDSLIYILNNIQYGEIDYLLSYNEIIDNTSSITRHYYELFNYDNANDDFSSAVEVGVIEGNLYIYTINTTILFQYLIDDYSAFLTSEDYSITAVNTMQEYTITQHEQSTLDNAFYYGVDQMTKSELFNWTQNTALYSGIKAMTDNLQIQTNAIAILLTYWFILTIIYIIVDIVLKLFTTITHLGTKD